MSEKLIRFHTHEPPPIRTKDAERERLEREIADFLARGGEIRQCAHGESNADILKGKFKITPEGLR